MDFLDAINPFKTMTLADKFKYAGIGLVVGFIMGRLL